VVSYSMSICRAIHLFGLGFAAITANGYTALLILLTGFLSACDLWLSVYHKICYCISYVSETLRKFTNPASMKQQNRKSGQNQDLLSIKGERDFFP
jgi:hypothetical protein